MIDPDWDFCVRKVLVRNLRKSSYMRPQVIPLSTAVTNLGMRMDSHITFNTHIKHLCKNSFYHLRNISKLRPHSLSLTLKNWFTPLSPPDWITVKLVKLSFIVPFWVEILSLLLTHAGAGEQPWSSGQMQCSALGAGGGFRCLALGHLIRG